MEEFDVDDFLEHHGTVGMKWGVWNAETAARYLGKGGRFAKKTLGKAGNLAKNAAIVTGKHAKNVAVAIGTNTKEAAGRAAEKKKAEMQRKAQQKAFDKQTKEKYHLSAKKYNELRTKTLNSNDPSVVAKGMHLLTDEELNSKIDRLRRESDVRNIATVKEKREAERKKEQFAAKQNTLGYKVATMVADKALEVAKKELVEPASKEAYKIVKDTVSKTITESNAKKQQSEAKQQAKKQANEEKQAAKDAERREIASRQSQDAINTIHRIEEENNLYRRYDSNNPDHFRDEEWYRIARKRLS